MRTLMIAILLVLVSCGKKTTSANKDKRQDPYCGGNSLMCMPNIPWTVVSRAAFFPRKFQMMIYMDGTRIAEVDTCRLTRDITTVLNGDMLITLPLFEIAQGTVEVEILDRGMRCQQYLPFFPRNITTYGVMEARGNGQVIKREVKVYLNN